MFETEKYALFQKIYELGGILSSNIGFKLNLHNEHPDIPLSPIYLDLGEVLCDCKIRMAIAKLFLPYIENLNPAPQRLVDLPQSVSPLTTTISDLTQMSIVRIRSELLKGSAPHDTKKPITGFFIMFDYGLIVDDVVSGWAHTKFLALKIVEEAGLSVKNIFTVFDREEGGKERLKRAGYDCFSLFKLSDLLDFLISQKYMPKEIKEKWLEFSAIVKKSSLSTY